METKKFRKGDVIIEKGSYGICAYVIKSGRVEVSDLFNNKKTVLGILEKEQIFGEMGLVEDQPRSVTVTAIEDVQLAVISRDSSNDLLKENPKVLLKIIKSLFDSSNDLFKENPKVLLKIIKSLFEVLRTTNRVLMSKDAPDIVEKDECKYPHNSEFIILSGLNRKSSDALGGGEMIINTFPFMVGRRRANNLQLQDFSPYCISKNHFLINKVEGRR